MTRIIKYIASLTLLFSFIGCSTSKGIKTDNFQNEYFTVSGVKNCKEVHTGDAVDSQIGEISCNDITFAYDYGRYGQRVPMTPAETFREAFDNYHYSNFFELTHVDTKVQAIFKDSVSIVELHKGPTGNFKTMFDCSTCNAVAEMKFKNRNWFFPATVSKEIFNQSIGNATTITKGNQQTRVYINEAGITSAAAYWLPYRRHRDFLAITVKDSTLPTEKQSVILHSIILKKKK